MDWARMLAYITGTVDQALLLRNEYLAAENLTGKRTFSIWCSALNSSGISATSSAMIPIFFTILTPSNLLLLS